MWGLKIRSLLRWIKDCEAFLWSQPHRNTGLVKAFDPSYPLMKHLQSFIWDLSVGHWTWYCRVTRKSAWLALSDFSVTLRHTLASTGKGFALNLNCSLFKDWICSSNSLTTWIAALVVWFCALKACENGDRQCHNITAKTCSEDVQSRHTVQNNKLVNMYLVVLLVTCFGTEGCILDEAGIVPII